MVLMNKFDVQNLTVKIQNNRILSRISFNVKQSDVLAIVGLNGAGKSTLLKAIMNHFNLNITGSIKYNDKQLVGLDTDQIAKLNIFYGSQNPTELDGVQMIEFLKLVANATKSTKVGFYDLYKSINVMLTRLDLPQDILNRSVNVGFSGGQKKKNEILQAELFNPSLMLLDEIDSGLDVDAMKIISNYINQHKKNRITIIVSHHLEFLDIIKPNKVLVLSNGVVAKNGGAEILKTIKSDGYKNFTSKNNTGKAFTIEDPFLTCKRS
jgi:Fe-S cluster assembly ATP-binding protein